MKLSGKETPCIRLQVFLSRNGVCSRRKTMELIFKGRVSVNGETVQEPSTRINPRKDKVCVDGTEILEKAYEYILLNKPKGYVTTKSDRHAQKTVFDLLPQKYKHLSPAGRLDKDSEGLLLLTNDGDTIYKLTHPKFNVDKTYFVRILGQLSPSDTRRLERGIDIEGKTTTSAQVKILKTVNRQTEFYITIHEGRKRQIRLMLKELGRRVIHLKRISQGPLSLGPLSRGTWRFLNKRELSMLKK